MKIAPISRAIIDHNAKKNSPEMISVLVHTGQHYDEEMSKLFFDELEIPKPDYNLEVGSGSHAFQTAEVMKRIEPILLREQPDYVLVVGDVNSTIAAALVAKKLGIRVIHVEAGLRSFDRTMPEEINRILTDAISDLLFITEKSAETNLLKEGIPKEKIYFVGNVMIDTLLQHKKKAEHSDILSKLDLMEVNPNPGKHRCGGSENGVKPFALLTLHRPSNVDDVNRLRSLLDAMVEISRQVEVIFPAHPRTVKQIKNLSLDLPDTLKMLNPLGYLDFLKLMASAKLVLTDSGGIQEETTVLGVPCLTLRECTERPVTITEGTNRLVPLEKDKIIAEAFSIIKAGIGRPRIPNLWDGKAAERIVEIISSNPGG